MVQDPLDLIDEWGPEKVVLVSERKSGMRGVLVIDNTARGAGKGGTRMSPTLTTGEVARLARTMTWKWAAVDLFHGGAKAGILGDPRAGNKEQILRGVCPGAGQGDTERVRVRPRHGAGRRGRRDLRRRIARPRGVDGPAAGAGWPAVRPARRDRVRRGRGGRCGRFDHRPRSGRRPGRHPGFRCGRSRRRGAADRARRRRGRGLDRHRVGPRSQRSRGRRAERRGCRPR